MATNDRITATGRDATTKADALVHSKELDGFRLPDGDPDPRGWDVRSADGQKLGKVHDLLVESGSARVRYLEVAVDKDVAKNGGREWALIPIGTARLDDDNDDVIVGIPAAQLAGCPDYKRGVRLDRTQERAVRDWARGSGHGATVGAAGVGGAAVSRAEPHGVLDRVGDKLDDLKDRVDGNPPRARAPTRPTARAPRRPRRGLLRQRGVRRPLVLHPPARRRSGRATGADGARRERRGRSRRAPRRGRPRVGQARRPEGPGGRQPGVAPGAGRDRPAPLIAASAWCAPRVATSRRGHPGRLRAWGWRAPILQCRSGDPRVSLARAPRAQPPVPSSHDPPPHRVHLPRRPRHRPGVRIRPRVRRRGRTGCRTHPTRHLPCRDARRVHAAGAAAVPWLLRLAEDGRYAVTRGGQRAVDGRYRLAADTIVFSGEAGPQACPDEATSPGTYRWRREAHTLTLTPLADECSGRRAAFAGRPLTRADASTP
jgi:hypothetical protein